MAVPATQSINSHNIKIVTWNANGLLARKAELLHFLSTEKIDVALIIETRLSSRQFTRFAGYRLYTCDHTGEVTHGGLAILIRNNLGHHLLNPLRTPHLQATCISIKLWGIDTTVGSGYSPPWHHITADDYRNLFFHLGPRWIANGYWNAKHPYWCFHITTTKGRSLFCALEKSGSCCITSHHPTFWPTDPAKQPDCIDFYITKGVSTTYMETQVISDLSSDHSPVVLYLRETPSIQGTGTRLSNGRTDWIRYADAVSSQLDLSIKIRITTDLDCSKNIHHLSRTIRHVTSCVQYKIRNMIKGPFIKALCQLSKI